MRPSVLTAPPEHPLVVTRIARRGIANGPVTRAGLLFANRIGCDPWVPWRYIKEYLSDSEESRPRRVIIREIIPDAESNCRHADFQSRCQNPQYWTLDDGNHNVKCPHRLRAKGCDGRLIGCPLSELLTPSDCHECPHSPGPRQQPKQLRRMLCARSRRRRLLS
jgi:hypothetical protein